MEILIVIDLLHQILKSALVLVILPFSPVLIKEFVYSKNIQQMKVKVSLNPSDRPQNLNHSEQREFVKAPQSLE